MFKIFTISILLTMITFADGPVLQTGQTQSYDADGNVVTDGSVKDDGYYQAGIARSYGRDGDIVIDNTTGLEWEDNESIEKQWVLDENYNGNDSNTSGDTATTYCEEFNLGNYEDWRLPSVKELQTIINSGETASAANNGIFTNIISTFYWTSTSYFDFPHAAFMIDFYAGQVTTNAKSNERYTRCVRGNQFVTSNYSRQNDIVSDISTGLYWQDNSEAKDLTLTWEAAIDYCENILTLGDYTDWRLPNKNELMHIVEHNISQPAINGVFQNSESLPYWTSTTYDYRKTSAWTVNFKQGHVLAYTKTSDTNYIRCVRGGQRLKQGTDTYIPGNPTGPLDLYLPNCESGRLVQGKDIESCDDTVDPVNPPGFSLPTCPDGERLEQGSSQCTSDGI